MNGYTRWAAYALMPLREARSCGCANAAASGQKAEGQCLLIFTNGATLRRPSFAVISMYWGSIPTTSARIRLCWRSWSKNLVRSVTRKVVNKVINKPAPNASPVIVFVAILDSAGSEVRLPERTDGTKIGLIGRDRSSAIPDVLRGLGLRMRMGSGAGGHDSGEGVVRVAVRVLGQLGQDAG